MYAYVHANENALTLFEYVLPASAWPVHIIAYLLRVVHWSCIGHSLRCIYATLVVGDYFGEIALLKDIR